MPFYRIIASICLLFILIGCGKEDSALDPMNNGSDQSLELSKVSDSKGLDQHVANRAKERLSTHGEITSIKAVNSKKKMLIAIDIKQMDRFNLADIRKKFNKEMKDEFPAIETVISTDKKIYLELEKLEQDIESTSITEDQLNKRLKKTMELEKEET